MQSIYGPYAFTDDYSDVYSVTVSGDQHLAKYQFLINGQSVRDPYGVMVDPATGANVVIDLSKTERLSADSAACKPGGRDHLRSRRTRLHD